MRVIPLAWRSPVVALLALGVLAGACTGSAAERDLPRRPGSAAVPTTGPAAPPATSPPATSPPATSPPATSPPATSPPATVPPTTEPLATGPGYSWRAGDCFQFGRVSDLDLLPYAPYGDADLASCEDPHTHEAYHMGRVAEGPDAPFPPALNERVDARCSQAFLDAYGIAWPDSTYSLIRYLPDEDEWAAGERYVGCVLYRPDVGGTNAELREPAGGAGTAWPATVGACFAGDLGSIRNPDAIDCEDRHTFEVVGVGEHPGPAGSAFPGETALLDDMREFCTGALADYRSSAGGGLPISVVPIRWGRAQWDLGYRRIRCVAFTLDGVELQIVRGSYAGDWDAVGPAAGELFTA